MKFHIEHHAHGAIMARFECDAREAGCVGVYRDGRPWTPCEESAIAAAPYRIRKAMARGESWWQSYNMRDVMQMNLSRARDGAPMGTLIARLAD